jgi:hypothetical protein
LAKHARTAPALCCAASRCVTCCHEVGGLDTAFRGVLQRVLARIRVFPALLRQPRTCVSRRAKRGVDGCTRRTRTAGCVGLPQMSAANQTRDVEDAVPYGDCCSNGVYSLTASLHRPPQQHPPRRDTHHIAAQCASAIVRATSFRLPPSPHFAATYSLTRVFNPEQASPLRAAVRWRSDATPHLSRCGQGLHCSIIPHGIKTRLLLLKKSPLFWLLFSGEAEKSNRRRA